MHTATWFDPAFRQTLVRYARRRVPAAEVDDVVQEALCDALASNAPKSRPEMLRWSLTILRRRIVDSYRARRSHESLDAVAAPDPEPTLEARDVLARLEFSHDAMGLILAESEGNSLERVACDHGLTPEATRQRVSRHRRHLRAWLAAAAVLGALAVAYSSLPEAIGPEPAPAVGDSLDALDGTFVVERVTSEQALARAFGGRTLRVAHGAVTVDGRPWLTIDSVLAGSVRAHDGRGVAHTFFVRHEPGDHRWQLESWSGPWQGQVLLRRGVALGEVPAILDTER